MDFQPKPFQFSIINNGNELMKEEQFSLVIVMNQNFLHTRIRWVIREISDHKFHWNISSSSC